MSLLSLEAVHARLGAKSVLESADLSVASGQVVVLCGPNGAGKSSAIRVAAGLLPIHAGEVRLGDERLDRLSHRERAMRFAYLPQERRIAWTLPAVEVAALGAPFLSGSAALIKARAALEEVGVGHLAGKVGLPEGRGGRDADRVEAIGGHTGLENAVGRHCCLHLYSDSSDVLDPSRWWSPAAHRRDGREVNQKGPRVRFRDSPVAAVPTLSASEYEVLHGEPLVGSCCRYRGSRKSDGLRQSDGAATVIGGMATFVEPGAVATGDGPTGHGDAVVDDSDAVADLRCRRCLRRLGGAENACVH